MGAEGFWGRERANGLRLDVSAVLDKTGTDADGFAQFDNAGLTSLAYVKKF